jgi:hypothetical protein
VLDRLGQTLHKMLGVVQLAVAGLQEPSDCAVVPGGQQILVGTPLTFTVCAPHGQHTPEKDWPDAVMRVEQGSLQQPLT